VIDDKDALSKRVSHLNDEASWNAMLDSNDELLASVNADTSVREDDDDFFKRLRPAECDEDWRHNTGHVDCVV